ncbi:DNA-3-methyladenine glycosylase I [Pseudoalteromonas sp. J010]|uniref:DNA-3-methyladenine glycosylase I n=1 Tax=Pseudoalteromonas sp. J010 TaxID=998465 RepID=UPI000F6463D5|nr:DNA-3-methyladenine glycosylase I [Pseudoalteromonas sp. J010]RRS09011.1 DNA-3-methyladenine glycosylase I [Pseudoalteromonas sp. J010]
MNRRCSWVDQSKPDYIEYHDKEWGKPVLNDKSLFEFLTLESAQAGLSWYTILKKREGYRQAFHNFDVQKVSQMTEQDIERLLTFDGIIRNRAKIAATINNARHFIEIQQAFGSFARYQWGFVDYQPIVNKMRDNQDAVATSEVSDKFAKDLKKRGFKFLGSTTVYAHMQACGMVNDHADDCFCKQAIIDSYASLDFSKIE